MSRGAENPNMRLLRGMAPLQWKQNCNFAVDVSISCHVILSSNLTVRVFFPFFQAHFIFFIAVFGCQPAMRVTLDLPPPLPKQPSSQPTPPKAPLTKKVHQWRREKKTSRRRRAAVRSRNTSPTPTLRA